MKFNNKATTISELMVVLLIISVAIFTFLKASSDYLRALVFAKDMFVLENLLHTKYQLLIAYRNKQIEKGFPSQVNWDFQSGEGDFCIDLKNQDIQLLPGKNCSYNSLNGTIQDFTYTIHLSSYSNYVQINLEGQSYKIKTLSGPVKFTLNGIITKWHPAFQ